MNLRIFCFALCCVLVVSLLGIACDSTRPPQASCTQDTDCVGDGQFQCLAGVCLPRKERASSATLTEPSDLMELSSTENAPEERPPEEPIIDAGPADAPPTEPAPQCRAGAVRDCYPESPDTAGCQPDEQGRFTCQGICQVGQQECEQDGTWGQCQKPVTPQQESCNGTDDDCDGVIDEVRNPIECRWSRPIALSGNVRWRASAQGRSALYAIGQASPDTIFRGKDGQQHHLLPPGSRMALPNSRKPQGFLLRLHPDGYVEWVRPLKIEAPAMPISNNPHFVHPNALVISRRDDDETSPERIYLTGTYSGVLSYITRVDRSTGTLDIDQQNTPRRRAAFVMRADERGNIMNALTLYSDEEVTSNAIAVHNHKYLYFGGGVSDDIDTTNGSGRRLRITQSRLLGVRPYVMKMHIDEDSVFSFQALRLLRTKEFLSSNDQTRYTNEIYGMYASGTAVYAVGTYHGKVFDRARSAYRYTPGEREVFLLRMDQDANVEWIETVRSRGDDVPHAVLVEGNDIFVTGYTKDRSGRGSDILSLNHGEALTTRVSNIALEKEGRGSRLMFLARWTLGTNNSPTQSWLYAGGEPLTGDVDLLDHAAGTHLLLDGTTLYVGGQYRGGLSYYGGSNSQFRGTVLPYSMSVPANTAFRNGGIKSFVLAVNRSDGVPIQDAATGDFRINTYFAADINSLDLLAGFHLRPDLGLNAIFLNRYPRQTTKNPSLDIMSELDFPLAKATLWRNLLP